MLEKMKILENYQKLQLFIDCQKKPKSQPKIRIQHKNLNKAI